MSGYPCSSPGCENPASWAFLSEETNDGDPSERATWNYRGTLACDGHRDAAEDEALTAGSHFRLIALSPE